MLQGDLGKALFSSLATIAFILLVSLAVWEAVNRIVARQLSSADRRAATPAQAQRLRTLLPLLRNVVLVVLVTVVTFMVLAEVGLNIAPLLAGAGVVGLAIGFGAQTLVQDVISGLFNLFENTVAVGDVVVVGGHAGLVEGMSIRTLKLRDLSGNLHTLPFSQVTAVMNMTRGFSYYVFDIGVAYREDVDHVMEVIREVGERLRQDMPYSQLILAPIEILGVDAFTDSAVVIKARIKTTPINQWTVGREMNRRLKKRFDELGIEIPFPHQTIYFGEDKKGQAPVARVQVAMPELAAAMQAGRAAPTGKGLGGKDAGGEDAGAEDAGAEDAGGPQLRKKVRPAAARGDDAAESSMGEDSD
jgi:small conductance mechanosensitive channel